MYVRWLIGEKSVIFIAFSSFFTIMYAFFNILGDDIGFEEKNRILYMLSRGSQPRYQMTNNSCKNYFQIWRTQGSC